MAADDVLVLVVSATFGLAAFVVSLRRRRQRMALLLLATGVSWFLGGLGDWTLFWHRGLLTHALLAYPTGRLRGPGARAVVACCYILAIAAPFDRVEGLTVAYAIVVVIAAVGSAVGAPAPQRTQRWEAAAVAAVVMGTLGLGALARLRSVDAEATALVAYEVALVLGSLGLAAGDLWDRWSQPTTGRLVIELGASPTVGRISALVAHALGDPLAELFYWLPEAGGFVDEAGRLMPNGAGTARRQSTVLMHDGEEVGMLVHETGAGGDPELLAKVAALASLALAGVRLRADVQAQLVAVEASRRRVVTAADLERQQIAAEVRAGAARRLGLVADLLTKSAHPRTDLVDAARSAQRSLEAFAAGVDPIAGPGGGLENALAELVRAFPVQVRMDVSGACASVPAMSSAYFVCAEALSNIGKHAAASQVVIEVALSPVSVRVKVTDDGVGGASLSAGTGLARLRDRIEALGGTLTVDSPRAGGTRVSAVIPA